MPWTAPVAPVTGTVITTAWAVSNVVNTLNWLRQITGGSDPGASNRVLLSTGPTTTGWGPVPDAALLNPKVSKIGDVMTGDLQVNRAGTGVPAAGYLILGNNAAFFMGYDGSQHRIQTPRLSVSNDIWVDRSQSGNPSAGFVAFGSTGLHYVGFDGTNVVADGSPVWTDANSPLRVTTPRIADLAVTTAKLADGAVTAAKLASTVATVPSGLIAAFRTAAAIPAGWARCDGSGGRPNMTGRLLVGAGASSSGQTFAEDAMVGSTWTPTAGLSASRGSLAVSSEGIPVLTGAGSVSSGGGSTAFGNHGHAAPTYTVSGDPSLGGVGGVWIPPSYGVVWAIKS